MTDWEVQADCLDMQRTKRWGQTSRALSTFLFSGIGPGIGTGISPGITVQTCLAVVQSNWLWIMREITLRGSPGELETKQRTSPESSTLHFPVVG